MRRLIILLPLILILNGCARHVRPDEHSAPSDSAPAEASEKPPSVSLPAETSEEPQSGSLPAGAHEEASGATGSPLYLLYDEGIGKYIILDHDGNPLLSQPYDRIERIGDDRLCVSVRQPGDEDGPEFQFSTSLCALCDLSGGFLTDFQYEEITALAYRTDVALADSSDCYALLDIRTGKVLASLPSYPDSYLVPLDGGEYLLYSRYRPEDEETDEPYTYSLYSLDKLLDGDTEPLWTVEHARYGDFYRSAKDGIIITFTGEDNTARYQLMGPDGPFFDGRSYEGLLGFSEDLAAAMEDGLWGYLDRRGDWAIPPQFTECGDFSDGYAAVCQGELYGYIDSRGDWLVKPRYQYAGAFSEGCAMCETRDSTTGDSDYFLLGRDGREIRLPGSLYGSFAQGNGYALAYSMNREADGQFESSLWRVDEKGQSDYVGSYDLGFQVCGAAILCCRDPRDGSWAYGIYDVATGEWFCEPGEYQYFTQFYPEFTMELQNDASETPYLSAFREEMGVMVCDLIDLQGNVILTGCNYISCVEDSRAVVRKGFSLGMMDFAGNWLYRQSVFTGMDACD